MYVHTAALLYVVIFINIIIIILNILLVEIKELRVETHRVRTHFKLRELWLWRKEQNSEFPKKFFEGYLFVFVEYLCNRSAKIKTKKSKIIVQF